MKSQTGRVNLMNQFENSYRVSFESIQQEFNLSNKRSLQQLLKPEAKKPKFVSFSQLLGEYKPTSFDTKMFQSFSNSFRPDLQNNQAPPFKVAQNSHSTQYQDVSQNQLNKFSQLTKANNQRQSNQYQLSSFGGSQSNHQQQDNPKSQLQSQNSSGKQKIKLPKAKNNLSVIKEENNEESDMKRVQKASIYQSEKYQASTSKFIQSNAKQITYKNHGQFILPQNVQETLQIIGRIKINFEQINNQWIEFRLHDLVMQFLQGIAVQIKAYYKEQFDNVSNFLIFLDKKFIPSARKYFKQDQENIDLSTKKYLEQENQYKVRRNEQVQQILNLIQQNEKQLLKGKEDDVQIYHEIIQHLQFVDQKIIEKHLLLDSLKAQISRFQKQQYQQQTLSKKLQDDIDEQKQTFQASQSLDIMFFECLKNQLYEDVLSQTNRSEQLERIIQWDPYFLIVNQL